MTTHSHRSIDADTGIIDTLDGLLVTGVSIKVSTDRVDYMGGKGQKQVMILKNKTLTLSVTAKVLQRAGVFGHRHPGTGIHRDNMTEFHSGVALGFDASDTDGYFIYMPTDSAPQSGEYDDHTFDAELWQDADNTIDQPAAPSAV